jgi:hypothetical protein
MSISAYSTLRDCLIISRSLCQRSRSGEHDQDRLRLRLLWLLQSEFPEHWSQEDYQEFQSVRDLLLRHSSGSLRQLDERLLLDYRRSPPRQLG